MTDLRTIEIIQYDHVSARRLALTPDVCRGLEKRYIASDTETTGLDPESDRIVEFGAVLFENGVPADSFQCYVNPGVSISEEISALNHISDEILQTAPSEAVA
jgi:DNA polymerase III epsilon subunit-like protein